MNGKTPQQCQVSEQEGCGLGCRSWSHPCVLRPWKQIASDTLCQPRSGRGHGEHPEELTRLRAHRYGRLTHSSASVPLGSSHWTSPRAGDRGGRQELRPSCEPTLGVGSWEWRCPSSPGLTRAHLLVSLCITSFSCTAGDLQP